MTHFQTINTNSVYPSAIIQLKNGETITVDNVQFYCEGLSFIEFCRFDSKNGKQLENKILKNANIDFIQWR